MSVDPVWVGVARGLLALIFVGSAWHKLRAPRAFAEVVRAHEVLPELLAPPFARALPVAELASAGLLLMPATAATGAALGGALLLGYSASVALNLTRGRRSIDCGCSWVGASTPLTPGLLLRNVLLLGAAVLASASFAGRALTLLDGISGLLAVGVLLLVYLATERLLANSGQIAAGRSPR